MEHHEVEGGGVVSDDIPSDSGFAPIKSEFVLENHERKLVVECISEEDKSLLQNGSREGQPNKKQRLNSGYGRKLKGQNKGRPFPYKLNREAELCNSMVDLTESDKVSSCPFVQCKALHSVPDYLKVKPPNIGTSCYIYSVRGRCPRGISCRFSSEHTTPEGRNIVDKEKWESYQKQSPVYKNFLSKDLQWDLRKKRYNFQKSEEILKKNPSKNDLNARGASKDRGGRKDAAKALETDVKTEKESEKATDENVLEESKKTSEESIKAEEKESSSSDKPSGCVTDEDVITTRPEERQKLDWQGLLYLAPLTTVGNLPFRRLCREWGADITCSEMALASQLLQGSMQEWALVRRHESEKIFGVQVCGNNPYVLTRSAQLLNDKADIDFLDLNVGCPIDLLYEQGAGSALLRRGRVFEAVVRCLSQVLSPTPLTVKIRTGVQSGKNVAHNFTPVLGEWGAALVTLHGRSREQRYTKAADWEYIEECAKLAKPTPFFGNGDVLSFEDYERLLKNSPSITGIMIGRGALIKPWIFTEIKERRHWDISSSERFDMLKKYVNYGLDHWGSDIKGVENTRRFLLEWLSFLHRYIPVGLLERLPQRINQRPPFYHGRDDLETLMASSNCADWIRISEMLLGPVPEGFNFLPKHKANSWK